MNDALKILAIEDVRADFLLIERHLKQRGLCSSCQWVSTWDAFLSAIDGSEWDVVLSDYNLPAVEFEAILATCRARLPEVPLILVSGSIGDERAVELLKLGVWDFILKDNLTRLVPAIEHSLREAADRRARHAAEAALRESEERLRIFIEHAPASLAMFDLEMRYLSVSRRWLRDYDLGERSLIGLSHYEVFPEISEDLKAIHRRGLAGEIVRAENDRFERADGSIQWLRWEVRPWRDSTGNVAGIVIFSEDITDRKRAEETLRESELRLSLAMEAARMGTWDIDLVSDRLIWSEVTEALVGFVPGTFPGTVEAFRSRIHPDDLMEMRQIGWRAKEGENPFQYEYRVIWPDGSVHWLASHGRCMFDPQGQATRMVGVVYDISERKLAAEAKDRLESQLRQAQKLEAIGTLAGGIAHDFNNILSPIIGYTEIAMDGIPDATPLKYDLAQVLTAANRAKDLVRQILSFSRLGEEQLMRAVDVSFILKEALKLLRASLPSTIEIRQDTQKVMVVGDATQIHQVILNLCTNAAHAMEDRGILDVSLKEVLLSAQDLVDLRAAELRPGKHLKLSIQDTGAGMSPDTMLRIFDPYFTTKDVGKGTGLGLAVVHGIVKRHGGEILVNSEIGKGSVFDVYIPVVESELRREGPGPQALPRGTERILLVDDEPAIATMEARSLERLGYTVTAKTSPKEALDLFRSQPDQFDLIITDYTMPQMVGTDLARECMRIRPQIPTIVCTGYSEQLNREVPDEVGVKAVAMKPLDRRHLAMLVRDVLDKAKV